MRSRSAGVGVVVAVTAGLAGLATVTLGLTTPVGTSATTAPLAAAADAPDAASPTGGYPTLVDHCYIEGMIPHHEQALELSRLVLDAGGVRDRTRALAEFIVVDQSTEIETMGS